MNVPLIHLTPTVVQAYTIGSESTLSVKSLTQNALRFPGLGSLGSMGLDKKISRPIYVLGKVEFSGALRLALNTSSTYPA